MHNIIKINHDDDVIVLLDNAKKGEMISYDNKEI